MNVKKDSHLYGTIIAAVLDVAQFLYNLFQIENPSERVKTVPWAEYSQGMDTDMVTEGVFTTMQGTEWSRMFWPSLDWTVKA